MGKKKLKWLLEIPYLLLLVLKKYFYHLPVAEAVLAFNANVMLILEEEWRAAAFAGVGAVLEMMIVFAGERPLGVL